MGNRRRITSQTALARSFGGRSGTVSEELDRGGRPPERMSRAERSAARLLWEEAGNHYEDYADENHMRTARRHVSLDWVIAIGAIVFFVGGYLAFIAFLALTR